MPTETAVTMQDLELENAELLPSRETLYCWHPCTPCYPCCPPTVLCDIACSVLPVRQAPVRHDRHGHGIG